MIFSVTGEELHSQTSGKLRITQILDLTVTGFVGSSSAI